MRARFLLPGLLLTAQLAWAHGAVHDQIKALDARIAHEPANAGLYLDRGRLYMEDRHLAEAIEDFRRALKLDPGLRAIHYFQGDALLKSGDAAGAEREARIFLSALSPEDHGGLLRGHRLLGQSLMEQGRPLDAAGAFRSALAQAQEPDPAHYLECAAAYRAAGQGETALRVLDDGIGRMGVLPSLQEKAIEIEMESGRADGALGRLDRLIAGGKGAESWLYRKGEILLAAGRRPEARQAFESAAAALQALPAGRRQTRSMLQLRKEIEAGLAACYVAGR